MTTIYLVTSGSYSDYGINGAFSTKENAQFFINSKNWSEYDEPSIEEYELDVKIDLAKEGYESYWIYMARDGKVVQIEKLGWPNDEIDFYQKPFTHLGSQHWTSDLRRFLVNGKSEEHAIKIANERRTQLLAFDKWEE